MGDLVQAKFASCCKPLWRLASSSSSHWWRSMSVQLSSDSAAAQLSVWAHRHRSLVRVLRLLSSKCSLSAATSVLGALSNGPREILQWDVGKSAAPGGLDGTVLSLFPALRQLQLQCDRPRPHRDSDAEDSDAEVDSYTLFKLPLQFSRLTALTSLSAGGFYKLDWAQRSLPPSLRSLEVDVYTEDSDATPQLGVVAAAASSVTALQALAFGFDYADPFHPNLHWLELSALEGAWACQLTHLSMEVHITSYIALDPVSSLTTLQELAVCHGGEYLTEKASPSGPFGPLAALQQLRRVYLDVYLAELPAWPLDPILRLPCLEVSFVLEAAYKRTGQHVYAKSPGQVAHALHTLWNGNNDPPMQNACLPAGMPVQAPACPPAARPPA